ncbi:helix-turn-helix transcriptional regulator [Actinomycetospora soli]|uniref:helix-turn-helix transcriptional regulator n=1 Tax=Actinomycetospora soli TaxID=2893887 RepID=UPI001E4379D2|nr:helix-turn-helix transcriptional regulator [Actinomycetospora soli]MCD2188989.1 helix-turn-helix transcriptional regulator [Actinomycetospora soli]
MSGLRAARELRAFLRRHGCRTPGPASAVLDGLAAIVPSDCLALSAWDPASGRHRTLASSYPVSAMSFLNDEWRRDPLFLLPRRRREPVRIRDVEPLRRHGGVFDRVIAPGGFRAGMTQCLFAADGRYVGMINANALDDRLDDDVVHLVDLLSADLAAAVDPVVPPLPPTARLADGGTDGFLVPTTGPVQPLSPGARPELLDALAGGADGVGVGVGVGVGARLLVDGGEVLAVDVARSGAGLVVLHRPVPPPDGLTVRELHVLAALADGLSNAQIGRRCGISARTVGTHVEHILMKTGTRNRAEAAGRAAGRRLTVVR